LHGIDERLRCDGVGLAGLLAAVEEPPRGSFVANTGASGAAAASTAASSTATGSTATVLDSVRADVQVGKLRQPTSP
jgi:hypothetical protein